MVLTLKNTIKKKILISFYSNTLAILIITLLFFVYFINHENFEHSQQKLISLAQLTASSINSDDLNKLVSRSDEKSEEYRQIKDILVRVKQASPDVKSIYTIRENAREGTWEYVVADTKAQYSPAISRLGDRYEIPENIQMKEFYNRPVVSEPLKNDQWGNLISGYAPIKDNTGKVIGMVGLEIEVESILVHNLFLGIFAGVIILSFGLTTYSISQIIKDFLKPVNEITEGIRQVSSGNLDYRVNVKTDDELGVMAEMVNRTADVMISNQAMLEKDLRTTKEQRQNIFKVYSDVIYSVTQGKFNLVSNDEAIPIADEGALKSEIKLETAEDVGKVRSVVENNLRYGGFLEDRLHKILLCVSEAATNVIKHAKAGGVQIRLLEDSVRLVVLDHGHGMDFNKLPHMIFLKGFSTKISLGIGFSIIYKFADKIYLSTSKHGTLIAMDFYFQQQNK